MGAQVSLGGGAGSVLSLWVTPNEESREGTSLCWFVSPDHPLRGGQRQEGSQPLFKGEIICAPVTRLQ